MLLLVLLADLAAAVPSWQFIYHARTHDLVWLTDGRVLYRDDKREEILVAPLDALLSPGELRLFERTPETDGLRGCKSPEISLENATKSLSFCSLDQVRPPALARLFARLEGFRPPDLKPWAPTHYVVRFANIRRKGNVEEEGIPLTWPRTLPYPKILSMGAHRGSVLVEARLLPEVKRYRDADRAAEIDWYAALPDVDDR